MKAFILIFFLALAVYMQGCGEGESALDEQIAKTYCGSCHLFPDPKLLDKKTWEESILPKMGAKLGVQMYEGAYAAALPAGNAGGAEGAVSFSDWMRIVDYYTRQAPQTMPSQDRPPITEYTGRFLVKEPAAQESRPSSTYIQMDPGNRLIYVGNASDSSFSIFDGKLRLLEKQRIAKVPVHLDFDASLSLPGERSGLLTGIGNFYPNAQRSGTVDSFYISEGNIRLGKTIADSLPRPVQASRIRQRDDSSGLIVCGFGYETGELYYLYKKPADTSYRKKVISPIPGAVHASVDDFNKDGLQDIVVLFAQAEEGIFLFTNKGDGNFESKVLLRFPPVYGSTYFEMQDVNGDGLKDIVYTCGDNYDDSRILKNYHGVYFFLNGGSRGFRQAYFFPMNGCYKALARDFDLDGDIDIAAISFFPDVKNQPQESFVYLENRGGLRFSPASIPAFGLGNWITMDAADMDGDGDDDIVIGSLLLKRLQAPVTDSSQKKPSFLLLENQTR